MPSPAFRYHAFISCAPEDNRAPGRHWANWLQQALETFEVPMGVAGRQTPAGPVPPNLFPVCQDSADAAGEGLLDAATREALEQSRTLIVICSPHAAASRRVSEVVRFFKQLGRERVFALIVAGDPEAAESRAARQCFPETLRYDIRRDGSLDREWRVHPIAADARFDNDEEGFTTPAAVLESLAAKRVPLPKARAEAVEYAERLNAARLKIIAGVLGAPLPELTKRGPGSDLAAARRGQKTTLAAMLVVAILAAGAGWFAWQSHEKLQEAQDDRRRSDNLIALTQRSVSDKLRATDQILLLAETNELVRRHFQLAASRGGDATVRSALADALADGAEIAAARGNYGEAVDFAGQALTIRENVASDRDAPTGTELRLIADHRRFSQIFQKGGRKTEALRSAEKARTLATDLVQNRPGNLEALHELAASAYECGDFYATSARLEDAKKAIEEGHTAARRLVTVEPTNRRFQQDLADGEARLGRLLQQQSNFTGALAHYQAWQKIVTPLAAANPGDLALQSDLASVHSWLGSVQSLLRNFSEAAAEQRYAVEINEALALRAPANLQLQFEYAMSLRRLAESLLAAGPEYKTEALTVVERASDLLTRNFPDKADLRAGTLRIDLDRIRATALK